MKQVGIDPFFLIFQRNPSNLVNPYGLLQVNQNDPYFLLNRLPPNNFPTRVSLYFMIALKNKYLDCK